MDGKQLTRTQGPIYKPCRACQLLRALSGPKYRLQLGPLTEKMLAKPASFKREHEGRTRLEGPGKTEKKRRVAVKDSGYWKLEMP